MKSREPTHSLKSEGWVLVDARVGHGKLKHPSRTGCIIVPHPKKDLPIGTVHAIMKQAGLK